jgi:hypothetical protein
MFSLFRPARRQSKLANTKSRLLWPLRCSYLVCQVCRWFTAPRPAQTRTRSLHHAAPPADNSTGFCACTLYLVFKEPTPTEPDSRSRWPSPVFSRPSLGEPFEVTTEELLCQYPAKLFILQTARRQKNCSNLLRSNCPALSAGSRLPNESNFLSVTQYTRSGWAFRTHFFDSTSADIG